MPLGLRGTALASIGLVRIVRFRVAWIELVGFERGVLWSQAVGA
jgi:hypothetical protein